MICPHCKAFNVNSAKVCTRCKGAIEFKPFEEPKATPKKEPTQSFSSTNTFDSFNSFQASTYQESSSTSAYQDSNYQEELNTELNENEAPVEQVQQDKKQAPAKVPVLAIIALFLALLPLDFLNGSLFIVISVLSIVFASIAFYKIKHNKSLIGVGLVIFIYLFVFFRFVYIFLVH
ncbi:MAG: hypothetical protein IJW54_05400 [Clostridia bacterium]|nr:hypothetical protein [Clostridia bacterium]